MNTNERLIFDVPPRDFFASLLNVSDWITLQNDSQVSLRTIRSWRSGETSMPASFARMWAKKYEIDLPAHESISLIEKRRDSGSIGGKARQAIWGNPGTTEGRSLGGKRSIETHKKNHSSQFVPGYVAKPEHSAEFAELVGALLGDGTITPYQFIIYSNSLCEEQYAKFLSDLIQRIFHVAPIVVFHPTVHVIRTIFSRTTAIDYLLEEGLELGNKVKHQVEVPIWIKENTEYAKACLRGLIDTDGCVYLDRHNVKGKDYASLCIAFTNASIPLLDFVEKAWKSLGFSPTRFGRNVRLRRKEEILAYARQVGFSNTKHSKKIRV